MITRKQQENNNCNVTVIIIIIIKFEIINIIVMIKIIITLASDIQPIPPHRQGRGKRLTETSCRFGK